MDILRSGPLGRFLGLAIFAGVIAVISFSRPIENETPLHPSDWALERPIPAHDSVFLEDLTWMEIRDAITAGKTTAIIATGGVEPNGPYQVTGKHNVILKLLMQRIAKNLGDTLVAPIVPFVPEGSIDPPNGHMLYPGTISVSEHTFETLLTDVAESLKAHGFQHIVLLGDSGGNQQGLAKVAYKLERAWANDQSRIHYIPGFYDNARWEAWLIEQGYGEKQGPYHHDLRSTLLLYLADPAHVRAKERKESDQWFVNGVDLHAIEDMDTLANSLADFQAEVTTLAIRTARWSEQ